MRRLRAVELREMIDVFVYPNLEKKKDRADYLKRLKQDAAIYLPPKPRKTSSKKTLNLPTDEEIERKLGIKIQPSK